MSQDVEADARVSWRVEVGVDEDWRYMIRITDANGTREYFDRGEPEDNTFYRDYDWIVPELQRAYAAGAADREAAGAIEERARIVAWLKKVARDECVDDERGAVEWTASQLEAETAPATDATHDEGK